MANDTPIKNATNRGDLLDTDKIIISRVGESAPSSIGGSKITKIADFNNLNAKTVKQSLYADLPSPSAGNNGHYYQTEQGIYKSNGSIWNKVGYTSGDLDALLDTKANQSTTYTKTETNTLLDAKQATITASNGVQKVGVDVRGVDATTLEKGVIQLSNLYNGTSQTLATTEKALSDGLAIKQNTITTGSTAQYLKGDLSLSDFATDAQAAVVEDAINSGTTNKAPSQNAVKNYVDNSLQNTEDKFEIGRRIAKLYSSELYDVTAYLKNLTYTNISTEAQLLSAILVEGFVIKLTNNITVSSQINFAQKGVLHLNGFTINASVPTVFVNITKAVIISGGTLSHEKLTDTSVEVLVKINTPVNERAILHSLTLKHVEFGVDLSGSWALQNVNFEYNTPFGTATDSHRHIAIKTVLGDCFIDNITFSGIPQVATTRYTNFILADITEWTGNLHIRNVKQSAVGALRQFLNFQTLGANVTAGKLIVQDCNFNDLNGGIFFLTAGALDKMEYIILTNNEQGGDAIGVFKGLLYFSFAGALGTKSKIIHYNNKTLAGELRADYVSLIPTADTENAGIVARQNTVTINAGQEYAVANKSIIETFYQDFYRKGENDVALNTKQNITDNTLNTTSKTIVGGINELKTSIDGKVVDAINDGVTSTAPSQNAVFDALASKAPLTSPTFTGSVKVPTPSLDSEAVTKSYADGLQRVISAFGRTGVITSQSGDYSAIQITNTPTGNISATNVQSAINELDNEKQPNIGYTPENAINKDASGGYAGLTLFKINFKNALNTFTSFLTNSNTAARTYTFQDRDGTIADNTDLATKVNANTAIIGATKTKITYDSKGLVTTGDDATTADIADSLNKRYVSDAERTVIQNTSNTNTGDETTSSIQAKRPLKTIAGNSIEGTGNVSLDKSDISLGNVENVDTTTTANIVDSLDKRFVTDLQLANIDPTSGVFLAKNNNLAGLTDKPAALINLFNASGGATSLLMYQDGAVGYFVPSAARLGTITNKTNTTALSNASFYSALFGSVNMLLSKAAAALGSTSINGSFVGTDLAQTIKNKSFTSDVKIVDIDDNTKAIQFALSEMTTVTTYTITFTRAGTVLMEGDSIPASDITQTSSLRFVTDTEKTTWNAKLDVTSINDTLTSTSTTLSLSAKQGKALKDLIDALTTSINNKQDSDSDLTTIAGLINVNDNILQYKAGEWSSRTLAQLTADLPVFSSTAKGLVPISDASASKFLCADGTFKEPATSSANVNCSDVTADGDFVRFGGDKIIKKQTAEEMKTALSIAISDVGSLQASLNTIANKIDYTDTQTLTAAQKRTASRNLGSYTCLTTTERDSLSSWSTNEIIYNTTYFRFEKYNGTSWISTDGTIGMLSFSDAVTQPLHYQIADGSQVSRTGVYAELWTLNTSVNPSLTSSVFTITIASPAVITKTAHGLTNGQRVRFTTTGALPTGITVGVDYIVTVISVNTYKLSTTIANALDGVFITTTGTQSGVHSYTNTLYGQGNGTTTQNVLDARGLFLRGVDATRAIDGELFRANGSIQTDATKEHAHLSTMLNGGTGPYGYSLTTNGVTNTTVGQAGANGTFSGRQLTSRAINNANPAIEQLITDETRAKNYSSTIYIKYL